MKRRTEFGEDCAIIVVVRECYTCLTVSPDGARFPRCGCIRTPFLGNTLRSELLTLQLHTFSNGTLHFIDTRVIDHHCFKQNLREIAIVLKGGNREAFNESEMATFLSTYLAIVVPLPRLYALPPG